MGQTPKVAKDYPITPVPFTRVHLNDLFWSARIDVNRRVTIPVAFRQCEETGRIANFAIAGKLAAGKYTGYQFNDSDVFKVVEGASYALAAHPDTELEHYLDSLIAKIAAAQEHDGYLYTARTLMGPDYAPPGGAERWVGEKDGSHELYNMGHLYEAAVAHYEATGKRTLLDVALANANLVCSTFGPQGRREVPGHQEIEIGLCRLYRLTGDERYLKTAKFFLDERGNAKGHELIGEYAQDHLPVLKQDSAVGHAVRAMYMYSGMADVAALTGDARYAKAIDKLWTDVAGRKMYVTGGIGAAGNIEGFGKPYNLPNRTAYCETCASIAFMLWNERMFLRHGDAKYIDVLERVLYNSFLSGIALEGDKFFYPNPLAVFTGKQRAPWFACACCPSNVARFIPSIPGYQYAHRRDSVFVNLFAQGTAEIPLADTTIRIRQETRYPWEGKATLRLELPSALSFSLLVRIPGWAEETAAPEELYWFADPLDPAAQTPVVAVNGAAVALTVKKGYAVLSRKWQNGDSVTIDLPMPVRRVIADARITETRGKVALQRGPIVYCAEGVDNEGIVFPLVLTDVADLTPAFRPDLLGGVTVVNSKGYPMQYELDGQQSMGPMQPFTAIPYYAWAHRGESPMAVWLASGPRVTHPLPAQTIAFTSKRTVSPGGNDADAVADQIEPWRSDDPAVPYLHWWPNKGGEEWVQYEFTERRRISGTKVYWFDDTGAGECRVPARWQILYRENGEWKPVDGAPYPVEKNQYTTISFTPVEADAVRLVVTAQADFSTGLYEWIVE